VGIFGGLIVSFFLFGFWNPYWRIADQDILLIYDAFLQNSSLPREVVVTPAHLSVIILSRTYRLLHSIGLLSPYSVSTIPSVSDVGAFNRAWTNVVQIGRLLSLAITLAYVSAFGFLLSRVVQNWRVVIIGMFALAYSGGIAMSVRDITPELLSGAFVTLAFLVLLVAAQSPRVTSRPLLIGAAALLATLAMDNKVQAIFLILAFPILLLPFGELSDHSNYWNRWRAGWMVVALTVVALLAVLAATPLFLEGLFPPPASHVVVLPIMGLGVFQSALAAWIALGILTFALVWRVPVAEAMATAVAIIGGVALGLLPLYISRETDVVAMVINPIASLYQNITGPLTKCNAAWCGVPYALIFYSLREMILYHSFFFQTSPRPEIFLEWAVIAATIYALRHSEPKVALQAALLIGAVLGIDTLQAARALKQNYFNFTDPPIIIAATILLAKIPALQTHRLTYPIGVALIVLHIAFSQAEPIKHAFLLRSGPEGDCVFLNNFRHMGRFPFCRT
jgi:hypothetical protein